MKQNLDPRYFRVVAVAQPARTDDLIFCTITLENMVGEQKTERIVFPDVFLAYDFYRTQLAILRNKSK